MDFIKISVSEGFRDSEAVASFTDFKGRLHLIRVEKDFLVGKPEEPGLPVAVIHTDPETQARLVELPHEAETGANRLWISPDLLVSHDFVRS